MVNEVNSYSFSLEKNFNACHLINLSTVSVTSLLVNMFVCLFWVFELGACEGTLACSTCHLIFEEAVYKKLGPVSDEEMDMLDLAYGLTDT